MLSFIGLEMILPGYSVRLIQDLYGLIVEGKFAIQCLYDFFTAPEVTHA